MDETNQVVVYKNGKKVPKALFKPTSSNGPLHPIVTLYQQGDSISILPTYTPEER